MTIFVAHSEQERLILTRRSGLAVIRQRVSFLFLFLGLIFILLSLRLASLMLFDVSAPYRPADVAFVPTRGDIVDRNRVTLARTISGYSIRVVPSRLLNSPDHVADELEKIFPDMTRETLLTKLTAARPSYLRRRALPEQVAAVNAIGEVAFDFPREEERLYPQRSLAAHAIGFTNIDSHGVTGIEGALDDVLRNPSSEDAPAVLSIDARVQAIVESELGKAVAAHQAIGGAGVILDVHSGEILAMASLPTFNPNKLVSNQNHARRNAVTANLYEMGSTFKPLTIAAAIDAGIITSMTQRYDATEPLKVGSFRIRDMHSTDSWLNIPEMLVHSSNIALARIGEEMGAQRMQGLFSDLGFAVRPAIDIKERAKPLLPKYWDKSAVMTTSYGHGIAVTPLHVASAYAALSNGGIWRPATLRKRAGDSESLPTGRRVFSAETSTRMRQLLRLVVLEGTGGKADAIGFRVAGKTGSAEKPSANGYRKKAVVSSFAGVFPIDKPRYAIVILLDEPQGNEATYGQRTGGWTAAPVVRQIVLRAAPLLGILPDPHRDIDLQELSDLLIQETDKPQGLEDIANATRLSSL